MCLPQHIQNSIDNQKSKDIMYTYSEFLRKDCVNVTICVIMINNQGFERRIVSVIQDNP